MQRHERLLAERLAELLEPHGFDCQPHAGGKHCAVFVTAPTGRRWKVPMSGSPRGSRDSWRHYAANDAKRILREYALTKL